MKIRAEETRCIVCGRTLKEGHLCDCCKESLALCDVEDYVARKTARKFSRGGGQTLSNGGKI